MDGTSCLRLPEDGPPPAEERTSGGDGETGEESLQAAWAAGAGPQVQDHQELQAEGGEVSLSASGQEDTVRQRMLEQRYHLYKTSGRNGLLHCGDRPLQPKDPFLEAQQHDGYHLLRRMRVGGHRQVRDPRHL